LHGRMAGWIRDLGVHMNAIILAIITTFSWWGVNNLGVGLHSYGFTEGVWGALFTSWGILGIFMLMGIAIWFVERAKKASRKEATTEASGKTVTA
ncbi:MAG: cytochrome C assembly protein, partial [Verrucomicrobiota bacterium]